MSDILNLGSHTMRLFEQNSLHSILGGLWGPIRFVQLRKFSSYPLFTHECFPGTFRNTLFWIGRSKKGSSVVPSLSFRHMLQDLWID